VKKLGRCFPAGLAPAANRWFRSPSCCTWASPSWRGLAAADARRQMPAAMLAQLAYERALEICWKSTLALLLWSAIDYLLQRQKLERDLRMSKQELRTNTRRPTAIPR